MKLIDRITRHELALASFISIILFASFMASCADVILPPFAPIKECHSTTVEDVMKYAATNPFALFAANTTNATWTIRPALRTLELIIDHSEQLQTNWVTVETIDLGASITNGLKLSRSIQVGKVTTNEIVRLEFRDQTKTVTFKSGESGYTLQKILTNEESIVTVYSASPSPFINWKMPITH